MKQYIHNQVLGDRFRNEERVIGMQSLLQIVLFVFNLFAEITSPCYVVHAQPTTPGILHSLHTKTKLSNLMLIVGYDVNIFHLSWVSKEGFDLLDKVLGFICVCCYVFLRSSFLLKT